MMYLPGGWGVPFCTCLGGVPGGGVPAQVDATENITLPQTSFAGGNKGNFVTRLLFLDGRREE